MLDECNKMFPLLITSITISFAVNILTFCSPNIQTAYAQANINDPNLKAELITGGLSFPTSIAFVDDNNILVLEKDGAVRLITSGAMQDAPVLQVPVDSKNERGLLGIAISGGENNNNATASSPTSDQPATVFLYFTEQ